MIRNYRMLLLSVTSYTYTLAQPSTWYSTYSTICYALLLYKTSITVLLHIYVSLSVHIYYAFKMNPSIYITLHRGASKCECSSTAASGVSRCAMQQLEQQFLLPFPGGSHSFCHAAGLYNNYLRLFVMCILGSKGWKEEG